MLIEKNYTPAEGDIISLRLINGDEVIARFVSQNEKSFVVSRPVTAVIQMTQQGPVMAFAPFFSTADENKPIPKIVFDQSRLLCSPIQPREDIAASYQKMTSPIETITKPGLLI